MTERDYDLIASALRIGHEGCPEDIKGPLRGAIVRIAKALRLSDDTLDTDAFLASCGILPYTKD